MRLFTTTLLLLATVWARAESWPEISTRGEVPLKLYVFDCGRIENRQPSLLNPLLSDDQPLQLVTPCFLIDHPQGMLMWDAGLSDELADMPEGIEVMNGAFRLWVENPLVDQLEAISVAPHEIDYLAFSHLHNDHTGNSQLFDQAEWLMQEAERSLAFSERASEYGYHPEHYQSHRSDRIISVDGHFDVFGDGSVVIFSTPGHTPGHQSLYVDLPQTGPVVLSGDLYHFALNRKHYGIPVWNDKAATVRSFAMVDTLLEKTGAQLWIQHDAPEFKKHKKAPGFYR